jgi:hypothetical protein
MQFCCQALLNSIDHINSATSQSQFRKQKRSAGAGSEGDSAFYFFFFFGARNVCTLILWAGAMSCKRRYTECFKCGFTILSPNSKLCSTSWYHSLLTAHFLIGIVEGGVQLGPLGTAATIRPVVPAPGDYDGEIGGVICKGNRITRRKPAPMPLCPPQIPHAARTRIRAAEVGSQRLTAWATVRSIDSLYFRHEFLVRHAIA